MTDRPSVSGTAYAMSRRADARSMLDPQPFDAKNAELYWGEPALLADLTDLLQNIGCHVHVVSPTGISFSAQPEALEEAFGVALSHDTADGGPVWTIKNSAGAAVPHIPPLGLDQQACLRGIVLELPVQLVGKPVSRLPDLQKKVIKEPYQLLPHMLRHALSAQQLDFEQIEALPYGEMSGDKAVEVVVVDSGWNPGDHSYWAMAGLKEAADRVVLVQNKAGLNDARGQYIKAMMFYRDTSTYLRNNFGALLSKGKINKSKKKGRIIENIEMNPLEILRDVHVTLDELPNSIKNTKKLFKYDRVVDASDAINKALGEQPDLPIAVGLLQDLEAALTGLELHLNTLAGDIPDSVPKDTPHDDITKSAPHGTPVVSQILGTAPETNVRVVQWVSQFDDKNLTQKFGHFAHVAFPSATTLMIKDLEDPTRSGSRIYNCSFAANHNVATQNNADPIVAARNTENAKIAALLQGKNCVAFFASGNSSTNREDPAKSVPPRVSTDARIESPNVFTVGSACWNIEGSERKLFPSDWAIGYFDDKFAAQGKTMHTPTVCGLSGSSKTPRYGVFPKVTGTSKTSYGYADGTSFATPQVVGVAAIITGILGNLLPLDLRLILRSTAVPFTGKGDFATPDWAKSVLTQPKEQRPGLVNLKDAVDKAVKIAARGGAKGAARNPLLGATSLRTSVELTTLTPDDDDDDDDDDSMVQSFFSSEDLSSVRGSDGWPGSDATGRTFSDDKDEFDTSSEGSDDGSEFIWPLAGWEDAETRSADEHGPLPPVPKGPHP